LIGPKLHLGQSHICLFYLYKKCIFLAYVQEIGRAGRSGAEAQAVLYFNRGDLASATMRKDMKEYCTNNSKCKREIINTFFGFKSTVKPFKCCSVCSSDLGLEWQFENLSVS